MTKYPKIHIHVSPDFKYLSEEQLRQMAEEAYSGEYFDFNVLLEKYGVKVAMPGKLKEYFPSFQHPECICPECNVVSWIRIGRPDDDIHPSCPVCGQILRSSIHCQEALDYQVFKHMEKEHEKLYGPAKQENKFYTNFTYTNNYEKESSNYYTMPYTGDESNGEER